jgi:hypothetical protein
MTKDRLFSMRHNPRLAELENRVLALESIVEEQQKRIYELSATKADRSGRRRPKTPPTIEATNGN